MGAKTRYEACLRKTTAGVGGVLAGTIDRDVNGTIWISQNLNTIPEGQAVEWRTGLVVEIDKTTAANVFAEGDLAGFDVSAQQAVLTGAAAKDYDAGRVRKASANGDATVLVELFDVQSAAGFGGYIDAAAQAISDAGAALVTAFYTAWTTTGAAAGTLADGIFPGQLKKVQLIVDVGDLTLTPVTLTGGTTITFADAGDFALLLWTGSSWRVLELGNDADGATAPVLA